MTTQVFVGVGSNIDRDKNIRGGLTELRSRYGDLTVSPVYQSKSFGFDGDDFYNLVAGFKTNSGVDKVEVGLREIEYAFGRTRRETRYSSRTLDIDLLLFGSLVCDKHKLPRIDITEYAFVLKPLCDLVPDLLHPENGKTVRQLWSEFEAGDQVIEQLDIDL